MAQDLTECKPWSTCPKFGVEQVDRPVENKQVRSVGLASVGMGTGQGGNEMRVAAHQAGHHGGRHQELHQREAQPLIEYLD